MGAQMIFNAFALPVFAASLISGAISYLAFKRGNRHGELYFGWLMIACSIYAFFYGLELSVQSLEWMKFFIKMEYIGAAFLAPFLVLFSFKFAGYYSFIRSKWSLAIFVIPILVLSMVMTNDIHQSFHKNLTAIDNGFFWVLDFEPGYLYWVHQGYAVLSVIVSNLIFFRLLFQNNVNVYSQVVIMLLGTLAAWSAHLAYVFGLMPLNLDPVPFAFSLSGIII